jgi:hypothetical protein
LDKSVAGISFDVIYPASFSSSLIFVGTSGSSISEILSVTKFSVAKFCSCIQTCVAAFSASS